MSGKENKINTQASSNPHVSAEGSNLNRSKGQVNPGMSSSRGNLGYLPSAAPASTSAATSSTSSPKSNGFVPTSSGVIGINTMNGGSSVSSSSSVGHPLVPEGDDTISPTPSVDSLNMNGGHATSAPSAIGEEQQARRNLESGLGGSASEGRASSTPNGSISSSGIGASPPLGGHTNAENTCLQCSSNMRLKLVDCGLHRLCTSCFDYALQHQPQHNSTLVNGGENGVGVVSCPRCSCSRTLVPSSPSDSNPGSVCSNSSFVNHSTTSNNLSSLANGTTSINAVANSMGMLDLSSLGGGSLSCSTPATNGLHEQQQQQYPQSQEGGVCTLCPSMGGNRDNSSYAAMVAVFGCNAPAVAKCSTCANKLCPACLIKHSSSFKCFQGNGKSMTERSQKELLDLDAANEILNASNNKIIEVKKYYELISNQNEVHLNNVHKEIDEAFLFLAKRLEDRKKELHHQTEVLGSKGLGMIANYCTKAKASSERLHQLSSLIDNVVKHATSGKIRMIKEPLRDAYENALIGIRDDREYLGSVLPAYTFAHDLSALQQEVKGYGLIRSRHNSGHVENGDMNSLGLVGQTRMELNGGGPIGSSFGGKQPPISRPISSAGNTNSLGLGIFNGAGNGIQNGLGGGNDNNNRNNTLNNIASSLINNEMAQGIANFANGQQGSLPTNGIGGVKGPLFDRPSKNPPPGSGYSLDSPRYPQQAETRSQFQNSQQYQQQQQQQQQYNAQNGRMNKRFNSLVPINSNNGDLNTSLVNGGGGLNYEKWSTGGNDSGNKHQQQQLYNPNSGPISQTQAPYALQTSHHSVQQQQYQQHHHSQHHHHHHQNGHHAHNGVGLSNSQIGDFNNKPVVHHQISTVPPKSQIKRQKMIYHCKFGEFGVLEGQFTEPSGVAVNAQNDIIVADTNNHRIQIFDKEGRFKFQFGECGKRDGQLLYPNRVAVVKSSGDIIVTERSPTHQVQIYNQYGQFVRKFGAGILQHPRGVCVDNAGRIIVVECKVMRVLIFDQDGEMITKFGCSKHLEFPNGVVVNDREEIFISDNRAHCVKVFNYDGDYLRQIGGEGITNYPIGVGINGNGEVTIADNHNNFNLTVFNQDGQLLSALESKVKHAQCFDVALMDDGSVVLASKDYRLYIYRYVQIGHHHHLALH